MAVKYDPLLGKLRIKDNIKQFSSDPASPKTEDAWILKTSTGGTGGGIPYGLLLVLTQPNVGGTISYEFKYRTKEGTTIAVALM